MSGSYIGQLERGYNRETGQPIRPTVTTIRLLANALGDGNAEETTRIFVLFLQAAENVDARLVEESDAGDDLERFLQAHPGMRAQLHHFGEHIQKLDPDELRSVLDYLEFVEARRARNSDN